jgi:hypothetical protein
MKLEEEEVQSGKHFNPFRSHRSQQNKINILSMLGAVIRGRKKVDGIGSVT